jgi:hypothetical protein
VKMQTKVNHSSWKRLEFMDNIANTTFRKVDIDWGKL